MFTDDLRHAVADLVSLIYSRLWPVFRKSQLKVERRNGRAADNHYGEPLPRRELRVDSGESRGRGCYRSLRESVGVIKACIADRNFVQRRGAKSVVPCIGILLPVLFVLVAEAGQSCSDEGQVIYRRKPFPEGIAPERILGVKGVVDPQEQLIVCSFDDRAKFEKAVCTRRRNRSQ